MDEKGKMYSNPATYSSHHSLQIRDTNRLVSEVFPSVEWRKGDVLMDVGCGSGDTTVGFIVPNLPDVDRLIAIDILPEMIEFGNNERKHPKVEYHQADIEEKSTLLEWEGKISKLVSIFCIHWAEDQMTAFRNIFDLLKRGGEAVLLFVIWSSIWECYPEIINSHKWNKFLKNAKTCVPESHYKGYGSSYYQKLLEDIGFQVIRCDEEKRIYSYSDDCECKVSVACISSLFAHIPDDRKEEFRNELFEVFMKHNDRDEDGKPRKYYSVLTLHLKKTSIENTVVT